MAKQVKHETKPNPKDNPAPDTTREPVYDDVRHDDDAVLLEKRGGLMHGGFQKVETVEEQGIGPRDPYPTGNPKPADESFRDIHGYDKTPDTADEQEQKDQLDADPET